MIFIIIFDRVCIVQLGCSRPSSSFLLWSEREQPPTRRTHHTRYPRLPWHSTPVCTILSTTQQPTTTPHPKSTNPKFFHTKKSPSYGFALPLLPSPLSPPHLLFQSSLRHSYIPLISSSFLLGLCVPLARSSPTLHLSIHLNPTKLTHYFLPFTTLHSYHFVPQEEQEGALLRPLAHPRQADVFDARQVSADRAQRAVFADPEGRRG